MFATFQNLSQHCLNTAFRPNWWRNVGVIFANMLLCGISNLSPSKACHEKLVKKNTCCNLLEINSIDGIISEGRWDLFSTNCRSKLFCSLIKKIKDFFPFPNYEMITLTVSNEVLGTIIVFFFLWLIVWRTNCFESLIPNNERPPHGAVWAAA